MPYRLSTSQFSFIQFAESDSIQACNWDATDMCLPVFESNDAWFQFFVETDTEEEASALCDVGNQNISLGLVLACPDGFLLEFIDKPARYRITPTKVLYLWQHGLPGFDSVIDIGECFHIKIELFGQSYCSNCLQRIKDNCHTSVVQFSNDDNFAGYLYCAGEVVEDDTVCDPTIIQFTDQATMVIPWTAFLSNKYGNAPTIQVWEYIDGELQQVAVGITMDTYPPTTITIDFGGVNSGVIKIM